MGIGKESERGARALEQRPQVIIGAASIRQDVFIVPVTTLIRGFDATALDMNEDGVHIGQRPSAGYPIYHKIGDKPTSTINILNLTRFMIGNSLETRTEWFKDLDGQVIVDLGAGVTADGYRFAQMTNTAGYIAIEGYFPGMLLRSIKEQGSHEDRASIPAAIIGEDMLNALRRFPSDAVSVLASSIDGFLFGCDGGYLDKVENEISRILHPKGVFLSLDSDLSPTKNFVEEGRGISLRKYFKDRS